MSLKEQFPDEATLRKKLIDGWGSFTDEINAAVGSLESEYKRVKRRQKIGGACFTALIVIFGFLDVFEDADWGNVLGDVLATILGILLFPVMLVLGYLGYRLMRDKNNVVARFNTGVNALLFPKVLSLFGLSGSYIEKKTVNQDAIKEREKNKQKSFRLQLKRPVPEGQLPNIFEENQQVMDLLKHSELATEPHNTVVVDDMLSIPWGSGALFLAELDLKHITGSGKNRKVKKIFSGYLISFDTNKPLTGKTFISTEGDQKGFGHKSFWKGVTKGNDVKETKLEWNDFEKLLHVATSDPSEARYVLSTNFMSDLYDWWQGKKGNIRISFIGTRMYMLFPDNGIRFHNTIPAIETTALQEYAMTIARPLMHVLHLIEDVEQKKQYE